MLIDDKVRRAMEAVELDEVKRAAAVLAKHGLGVFVPHMHTDDVDFAEMPHDMVQVERNCVVSFKPRSEATGVPVGWIAEDDGYTITMACMTHCEQVHNQTHGETHRRFHSTY